MKALFTIDYIQNTLGLYLLKWYIAKVAEGGFQAINVPGDVDKLVIVFIKVCRSLKVLHLMDLKELFVNSRKVKKTFFCYWRNCKNSCFLFTLNIDEHFMPSFTIFWEPSCQIPIHFAVLVDIFSFRPSCYRNIRIWLIVNQKNLAFFHQLKLSQKSTNRMSFPGILAS